MLTEAALNYLPERRMQQQPARLSEEHEVLSIWRKGGCHQRSQQQLGRPACLADCIACRAADIACV